MNKLHKGECIDSQWGCVQCSNAANNGHGSIAECDICKKITNVIIRKALDENMVYCYCEDCNLKDKLSWKQETAWQDELPEPDNQLPEDDDYPDHWYEDEGPLCKDCGYEIEYAHLACIDKGQCEECWDKEDEAVEMAQQRQIDRWNED
tara:strand:+ start:242 stop:688 length:447 start_codon:yes stop_codon:yes gene_type:complete